MQFEAQDHYQTLGVAKNADPATIKRAYYKLIREHTPESNPAAFQRITEAYQTLSNPEKRRAYDAEEKLDPDVEAELEAILADHGDIPEIAAALVADIVARHPSSKKIRRVAGVLHMSAEEHDEACEVLEGLCDLDPDDSHNLVLYGRALLGAHRGAEAVQQFKSAIVLDPHNYLAYLSISDHHIQRDEPAEAIGILERGLMAGSKLDAAVLPLLQRILMIQAQQHMWDAMNATAEKIGKLAPPDDPEARLFIASELAELITPYAEAKRPDVLHLIFDLIVRLDPTNEVARNHRDELATGARTYKDIIRFLKWPEAPHWLRNLVISLMQEGNPENRQEDLEAICAVVAKRAHKCAKEWHAATSMFPGLKEAVNEAWEAIYVTATGSRPPAAAPADHLENPRPIPQQTTASSSYSPPKKPKRRLAPPNPPPKNRDITRFLDWPEAPHWLRNLVISLMQEGDTEKRHEDLEAICAVVAKRASKCAKQWHTATSRFPGLKDAANETWAAVYRAATGCQPPAAPSASSANTPKAPPQDAPVRKTQSPPPHHRGAQGSGSAAGASQRNRDDGPRCPHCKKVYGAGTTRCWSCDRPRDDLGKSQPTGCLGLLITCLLSAGALILNLLLS
jgi:tetratricopeptide (TPR) repeat protein